MPAGRRERTPPFADHLRRSVDTRQRSQHATPAINRLARFLDSLTAAGAFDGAVLVGRKDSILLHRGYGLARRAPDVPWTPRTPFTAASIGKMFTSVAVLQLIEDGRLRLSMTAAEAAPGLLPDSVGAHVTIEQLLTHTSGLEDPATLQIQAAWRRLLDSGHVARPPALDDTAARSLFNGSGHAFLRGLTFLAPPGTVWRYNNAGFAVLGAIIERVTGTPYHEHIQRAVLTPAGIRPPVVPGPLSSAVGYTRVRRATDTLSVATFIATPGGGTAFGGQQVSVDDLYRFARSLSSGRLLRRESLALMRQASALSGRATYGYGLIVYSVTPAIYGHSGGTRGVNNVLQVHDTAGYILIVLSNTDRGAELVSARASREFYSVE